MDDIPVLLQYISYYEDNVFTTRTYNGPGKIIICDLIHSKADNQGIS